MQRIHDTIAALATPLGTSAIALIRVSGAESAALASTLLGELPPARFAKHADYRDKAGALVDDAVFIFFKAPHSYTGEDALEISCHGNPYIAQRILEDLFNRGCRPAEPGEFTQRAFLGGRLDLSQAEAVMDIIHARSERALAAAHSQLRGSLGRRMNALVEELLGALARIEAYIDFPDEDLPREDRALVSAAVDRAHHSTCQLLATSHYGEILREGIQTVIIGEPNAGKSSLLNCLVGRDRAIVSEEPGTTRDFIEECVQISSHFLRLIDTAGINPAPQPIERLGMEKTLERAEEADLFLVVLDSTRPPPLFPKQLTERFNQANTIVVLNKSDLSDFAFTLSEPLASLRHVSTSALAGTGVDALKDKVASLADDLQPNVGNELIAINARHAHALERAQASLEAARAKLENGGPVELLASDMRAALEACGEIAGRIDNERMLDQLFATFCIGK
ncbi:MAG: tRNA uridine-5-carboxymethylaminomethyl(34) synthesis GTPase MnmE [Opitutaceae bacterium]|jgi:tRNA modification GTPase